MNEKTLSEIDYFRIREKLASLCITEEGRASLLERLPFSDLRTAEVYKDCSREWTAYLSRLHTLPLSGWEPVGPLVPVIRTNGSALSLPQVKALGDFCAAVRKTKETVSLHSEELGLHSLQEELSSIPDMSAAERKIFGVITPDGEMRDLPGIASIRREIASLHSKIKNIMRRFTTDPRLGAYLESSVPVLRSDRQVLAVKASFQSKINGIVHEISQTGQTVFIEPEEAVLCGNELVQKEHELEAEIKRVLAELTAELQASVPELNAALPVMIKMDTVLAAARWGLVNDCTFAADCRGDEPPLLLKARHPLLGDKAVPVDISFMSGKRVLVITGPNTGGKTVTLKTFALFAMMNQAGFPVLAAEGTRLPFFSDVFADIGDEQSLDQSLSTFSGHMRNIAQAVDGASSSTLVLLDELGSGTDPLEGTAIAMAVLDTLIQKKAFVLVTTHQGILKNYGYTNGACINASVEFDADTLSPSYRLIMGVPGESHALDIAQRSGIPSEIIDAARSYITTEQADVSALINGLNQKHAELDAMQRTLGRTEEQLEQREQRQRQRELELKRREHALKAGRQQELDDFLIHSRRQLENLVRTLKEGEVTREKTLGVKQFIAGLEKDVGRLEAKLEAEEESLSRSEEELEKALKKKSHPLSNKKTKKRTSNAEALKYATASPLQPQRAGQREEPAFVFECGAPVVARSNARGILVKEEKKGVWQVQFGSVRMSLRQKDLKPAPLSDAETPAYSGYSAATDGDFIEKEAERPAFELRLLGMRAEEARRALERQIDACVLSNLMSFSIIHGKGDGILQQLVRDYLSNCPVVQDFSFAPAEDGGFGKTYVTLRGR